jgi:hypothetical protein
MINFADSEIENFSTRGYTDARELRFRLCLYAAAVIFSELIPGETPGFQPRVALGFLPLFPS